MNIHDLSERKLSTFLFLVCFYAWFKVFWWIYPIFTNRVLDLSIGLTSMLDIVVIVLFVPLSIPVTLGLRRLLIKILEK